MGKKITEASAKAADDSESTASIDLKLESADLEIRTYVEEIIKENVKCATKLAKLQAKITILSRTVKVLAKENVEYERKLLPKPPAANAKDILNKFVKTDK